MVPDGDTNMNVIGWKDMRKKFYILPNDFISFSSSLNINRQVARLEIECNLMIEIQEYL